MFFSSNYYYFILGLQALCVFHCVRKGNQNKWIWLIVFLPVIGCLIYLFTEVFTGREVQKVQSGISNLLNPSGEITRLEKNLRFSDTFNNRVMLADAYLEVGYTDKAVSLYESSLSGAFEENEHLLLKLISAYYQQKRYAEIVPIAKKIYNLPEFNRSRSHMFYAIALARTGNDQMAEKEFRMMTGRFSFFESRYQFGLFLSSINREKEASEVFTEMAAEAPHLSRYERNLNHVWISEAKGELKKRTTAA